MLSFSNENLLKLVFNSFSLYDIKKTFSESLNNSILYHLTLRRLNYEDIFKSIKISRILLEEEHNNHIGCITLLPDGNIISVSNDKTLKIWSPNTFQCIKTLDTGGQKDYIYSVLVLPDGIIASFSRDDKIKLWNIKDDYKCLKTTNLRGYTWIYSVTCLANGNLACSAFNQYEFCLLILDHTNDFNCIKVIKEHTNWVSTIINLSGGLFATGSHDKTIRIWDMNDCYKCIRTIINNQEVETLLYVNKCNLLLSARDNIIKLWSIENDYQCIRSLETDLKNIFFLLSLPNGFFAVNSLNKLSIWNLINLECINSVECEDGFESVLLLKDCRFASIHKLKLSIWEY
jgi:WD40 repeat protein